jgi:hypothetical protein
MLAQCAPGHTKLEKTHHWRITYGDRVYPTLPLGEHGRRANVSIQVGHVKKMAREFGILDCAKEHLPQLR